MCCSLCLYKVYLLYPAKYKWTLYYESLQYSSTLVDIPVLSTKYGRSPNIWLHPSTRLSHCKALIDNMLHNSGPYFI